jgi:pimeloyl-ACP methyl ester carboxylesterase
VVVLAPGFAAEKAWRLPAVAREFAARGVAALVFDYRGFGASDGTPRHVVDPERQVDDWRAAVVHAREHEDTGDRVGVWGTGFSAGHALTVAADEPVEALSLSVPFLDGRAQARHRGRQAGVGWLVRASLAVARDYVRTATFRGPNYVPVAGDPDEFAVLNAPGTRAGSEATRDCEAWPDECAARAFAKVPFYRPLADVEGVGCPTLVVQAADDGVVPAGPTDRLVDRLDDVERVRYDVGHFDPYVDAFDRVVEREASFLARWLAPGAEHERPRTTRL